MDATKKMRGTFMLRAFKQDFDGRFKVGAKETNKMSHDFKDVYFDHKNVCVLRFLVIEVSLEYYGIFFLPDDTKNELPTPALSTNKIGLVI